jgi:putative transcriptional regulator
MMSVQKDNKLGEFLKELRARLGLSQEHLAAELGVSFPTVSRWERGKSKPNASAFTILNQYMNRVGPKHPDLLVRFYDQISLQGARGPVFTKDSHFVVFVFNDKQGKQEEERNADLLNYVKETGQALEELFRKAQSGDADARETLRLTCEWVNTPGRAGLPGAARAGSRSTKGAGRSKAKGTD